MNLHHDRLPISVYDDPLAGLCAPRPTWQRDALCLEYPDVSWFPGRGGDTKAAKAICARCAVRDECLTDALDRGEQFGVWGGTSEAERKAPRRAA